MLTQLKLLTRKEKKNILCTFFVLIVMVVIMHQLVEVQRAASNLLKEIKTKAFYAVENKNNNLFPTKILGNDVVFFLYKNSGLVDITIEDASPIMCTQIVKQMNEESINLFINDQQVIGSDIKNCKILGENKMSFQFVTYEFLDGEILKHPKRCSKSDECEVGFCYNRYCSVAN